MKNKRLLLLFTLMTIFLGACQAQEQTHTTTKKGLNIVTTFYPMYDFTKAVVGEDDTVTMLIQGEIEPHDYEPSAKDIAKIQDADVFIYNSHEMESWVEAALKSIDTSHLTVIEASAGIELLAADDEHDAHDGHEHAHGVDPHVWLDPVLAQQEVQTITAGLSAVEEKNKAQYEAKQETFLAALKELDQAYQEAFAGAKQRQFVTQHTAFSYLAQRYQLEQISIAGLSPDQEPSPASLAKIETFMTKQKLDVIYTEELSSSKIAETIAAATGAKLLPLNTLEGLSQERQGAGENYLSVMKANLAALKESIK